MKKEQLFLVAAIAILALILLLFYDIQETQKSFPLEQPIEISKEKTYWNKESGVIIEVLEFRNSYGSSLKNCFNPEQCSCPAGSIELQADAFNYASSDRLTTSYRDHFCLSNYQKIAEIFNLKIELISMDLNSKKAIIQAFLKPNSS